MDDLIVNADGTAVFLSGGGYAEIDARINMVHIETTKLLGWPYVTAPYEAIDASIAASDDGRVFAVAGSAGVLTLWAPEVSGRRSPGHAGPILGVSVAGGGRVVATAGQDRTVRLWGVADGVELSTLRGHARAVNDVCFGPDGEWLVSVGSDRTVRLWRREP